MPVRGDGVRDAGMQREGVTEPGDPDGVQDAVRAGYQRERPRGYVDRCGCPPARYRIASDGALALLGSTQVSGTNAGAVDARLSPGGRFLYLDESAVGKVGAFAVTGGNLTELASSPFQLPAGAAPAGIVVT
jgi:hypothetical protein